MSETIFSVTQLNHAVRDLLESEFLHIVVEGEISNFVCPASGHWYFSLKDEKSQIRCAMFRGANRHVKTQPESGALVQIRAKVSLYPARGDYQLIVEHLEEVGDGALQRAYEQLKNKLNKEGLFADAHKQTLPEKPSSIGIVTSGTGAAVHDIIKVLKRRSPSTSIIVYPCLVQGDKAAKDIVNMIQCANERQECEVLIVGRGGGSLEDLWPFNEEVVARAIFDSQIPVISAVGHEVDVSIADFVADVRAATPSAAAEIVSPDQRHLLIELAQHQRKLCRSLAQVVQSKRQHLQWLSKRLRHPRQLLQEQMQHLDYLWQQLVKGQRYHLEKKQDKLAGLSRALNTVSPLATLDRGYSILLDKHSNVIQKTKQVKSGDSISAKVSDGKIDCVVQ